MRDERKTFIILSDSECLDKVVFCQYRLVFTRLCDFSLAPLNGFGLESGHRRQLDRSRLGVAKVDNYFESQGVE